MQNELLKLHNKAEHPILSLSPNYLSFITYFSVLHYKLFFNFLLFKMSLCLFYVACLLLLINYVYIYSLLSYAFDVSLYFSLGCIVWNICLHCRITELLLIVYNWVHVSLCLLCCALCQISII